MKQPPLHINVPKPCDQDWSQMPQTRDGRHCSKCNHVLYDFSQMEDDELLNFLREKPEIPCGRFLSTQLNRAIVPAKERKNIFFRFNKVAAAVFTLLSLKVISAKAHVKNAKAELVFDSNFKNKFPRHPENILITGTIKDDSGNPLQNAKVRFDSEQMAVTDKDGKFTFSVNKPAAISHNIYFTYDSLVTMVRSYHPAMQSVSYDDIVLYKPGHLQGYVMGVPVNQSIAELPASVTFKPNSSQLNNDQKKILVFVAEKLRTNPGTNITIHGYSTAAKKNQVLCNAKLENIRSYLVEVQGISDERMTLNSEIGGGDINVVDIKQDH